MTLPLDAVVPLDTGGYTLDGVLLGVEPEPEPEPGEPPVPQLVGAIFFPPTVDDMPRWEVTSRWTERQLFRHFGHPQRGINVWKTSAGYVEEQPDDEDIVLEYQGGHYHYVENAEAVSLIAAGYGDWVMFLPSDAELAQEFTLTSTNVPLTTAAWDLFGFRVKTRDHPTWPLPPVA